MKFKSISRELIDVPEEYPAELDSVADDRDFQSIKENGIQQHLAVIAEAGRYVLIDGVRRFRFAGMLKHEAVPCDIHEVPEGEEPDTWRRTMRVILNFHRQDLIPSQKAEMASEVKRLYGLTDAQLGEKCGVSARTIRNWLAVKSFLPEIQRDLDDGKMNVGNTRVFVGLSEAGQRHVLEHHRRDLETLPPSAAHRLIRSTIAPSKHPEMYANATRAKGFVEAKKSTKRKGSSRKAFSKAQRQQLLSDYETRESEIRAMRAKSDKLEASIPAAQALTLVILRNEDLLAMVDEERRQMLRAFSEVVV